MHWGVNMTEKFTGTITVDFNNLRLSACENMNLLIEFLNSKLNDEMIELNINDCIMVRSMYPKSFEEIIDSLRSDLVLIGSVYSKTNDEIGNISEKVNIACFNSENN